MTLFFVLLSVLVSGFAHAGEVGCSSVDLREKMSPEMSEFFSHPRDMGGPAACYAYASADAESQLLGRPVSALHAYTLYLGKMPVLIDKDGKRYDSMSQVPIRQGGTPQTMLWLLSQEPACWESDLPSDFHKSFLLRKLTEFQETWKTGNPGVAVQCLGLRESGQSVLPNLNLDQITPVLEAAMSRDPGDFEKGLLALSREYCRNRQNVVPQFETYIRIKEEPDSIYHAVSIDRKDNPKVTQAVPNPKMPLVSEVDRQLDQGRMPLVTYDTNNVVGFFYRGENHVSSLLMRKEGGRKGCLYFIRNPWGSEGCNTISRFQVESCDEKLGGIWVTREKLNSMLSAVTWIEPKEPHSVK